MRICKIKLKCETKELDVDVKVHKLPLIKNYMTLPELSVQKCTVTYYILIYLSHKVPWCGAKNVLLHMQYTCDPLSSRSSDWLMVGVFHRVRFTLSDGARHEINVLRNQVRVLYLAWIQNLSSCADAITVLCYWMNHSSYYSSFVRQEDTLSLSLCHVQSPCSSRPQRGCLSNTACFDKWLWPWMVLDLLSFSTLRNRPAHLLKVGEIWGDISMGLDDDLCYKTCLE